MKTAKFIKGCSDFTGDAKLFALSAPITFDKPWDDKDPPARKTKYVIVSATSAPLSGPETYIFPADKDGNVLDWGELEGSYQGGLSHAQALKGAGYTLIGLHK